MLARKVQILKAQREGNLVLTLDPILGIFLLSELGRATELWKNSPIQAWYMEIQW